MIRNAVIARDLAGLVMALALSGFVLFGPREHMLQQVAVFLFVAGIAAWVSWQDLTDFTIPDGASAGLALVAVSLRIAEGEAWGLPRDLLVLAMVMDVAVAGGGLFLLREIYFRRRGFDGLGLGDVKFSAASALLLGLVNFSLALFAASLVGIGLALARRTPNMSWQERRLAFGAVLAPTVALGFALMHFGFLPGPMG